MDIAGPYLFFLLRSTGCREIRLHKIDVDELDYLNRVIDTVPLPFEGSNKEFYFYNLGDYILIPLLHELKSFTNLKKLQVHATEYESNQNRVALSTTVSRSICLLVKFYPTLEVLHLSKYKFTASSFEPIADCLVNAGSSFLRELVIDSCEFHNEAGPMFESTITSSAWKIPSVVLHGGTFSPYDIAQQVSRILTMKPQNSHLKRLSLTDCRPDDFLFMEALQNEATLDYLELGVFLLPGHYYNFMWSLMKVRGLKELTITLYRGTEYEQLRETTLFCLDFNHCLEEVSIYVDGTPGKVLEEEVNHCCVRNKYIKGWLADPTAVPDVYLPYIFEKTKRCWHHEDTVLKGLITSWMTK
jgi:hypothetical protein